MVRSILADKLGGLTCRNVINKRLIALHACHRVKSGSHLRICLTERNAKRRHSLILFEIRIRLTVILILPRILCFLFIIVKRRSAVTAIEHFFRIIRTAAFADHCTAFVILFSLIIGSSGLFLFKREAVAVFVCKMTAAFFFVTFSVMRCSAFGTNNNIVALFKLLTAHRTFVFCKFHY